MVHRLRIRKSFPMRTALLWQFLKTKETPDMIDRIRCIALIKKPTNEWLISEERVFKSVKSSDRVSFGNQFGRFCSFSLTGYI